MSILTVYPNGDVQHASIIMDFNDIASAINGLGMRFERWEAAQPLDAASSQDTIIAAYQDAIDRLMQERGFQSVDVVSLTPEHPDREVLRQKFLGEHTHDEDEVRFFVEGRGLFYVHIEDNIYSLLCEQGDLLSVPAGIKHWFDTGACPSFKCIRLFTRPDGWVAQFTGSSLPQQYPLLEPA